MNDEMKLTLIAVCAVIVGLISYRNNKKAEVKNKNFWPAIIFIGVGISMFFISIFAESTDQFHKRKSIEIAAESNSKSYSTSTSNTNDSKTCSWCNKSFSGNHYTHLGKMAPCQSSSSESSIGKYCSMKCCSEARKSSCPTCR